MSKESAAKKKEKEAIKAFESYLKERDERSKRFDEALRQECLKKAETVLFLEPEPSEMAAIMSAFTGIDENGKYYVSHYPW